MCVNAFKKKTRFLGWGIGWPWMALWTVSREVVTEAWWHYGLVE